MSFSGSRFRLWQLVLLAVAAGIVFPVQGQVPKKGPVAPPPKAPVPPGKGPVGPKMPVAPGAVPKGPKTVAPVAPDKKGPKLPEPEDVAVETKDGMAIKATYYPGTLKKEAVPFILIHGIDGQRGDMHGLATHLQSLGYAVIAPDLRGHGQSKKRIDGASLNLDPDKLTKPILEAMFLDVQACKKFLLDKHNSGDLNIEQLCVVGADFGAIVAVRWAAYDVSQADLPAYKLGKDVKALVLLSPPASYKAVSLREAFAVAPAVSSSLAMLIVAGSEDTKAVSEADKLKKQLQPHHSKSEEVDLFVVKPDTNLSGTKLLLPSLGLQDTIANFVNKTVVSKKASYVWQDRKSPF